ncbi:unnamed protein product [Rotaria magnacalcarata]|uniref:Uncharacterized protein n=1 Tax=Rotaria magnacalcarata TaxID=392030 RepID=A0A8S3FB73_9BILA|nr:unnamed protein product [Rotaria magnacalcarata]
MFSPPITDIVEISNSLDDDFPLQIDTLPVKESVTVTSKTTTATTSADSSSSTTINKLVQNLKRISIQNSGVGDINRYTKSKKHIEYFKSAFSFQFFVRL